MSKLTRILFGGASLALLLGLLALMACSSHVSYAAPPVHAGEAGVSGGANGFGPNPLQGPPGEDGIWRDVDETVVLAQAGERLIIPNKYRVLAANIAALDDLLSQAPLERTVAAQSTEVVLPLPLPDGTRGRFRIEEAPIMEPALAAQFPDIKTYRGLGLDDPTATAALDRTPAGFHAMILSVGGTVYIDPYSRGDVIHYISYYKRDYGNYWGKVFEEEGPIPPPQAKALGSREVSGAGTTSGPTLRTYRLAMAAAGEYTQYHGGTKSGAQAAIVTTVNRVRGIYRREVSVDLSLINNTDIIYTDANTDPYYDNTIDGTTLNENQAAIDGAIGSGNYDIGHFFNTSGGGLAGLGVVCNNSRKAYGGTGSPVPVGDPFDVDFVAHEMGHQFGANHTFNAGGTSNCSSGNRSSTTAYEPASGSTIMAYAGVCSSQNLQAHSDDYFHSVSFDEIVSFITDPFGGDSCDVGTTTGNSPPTVEAGPNHTIPISTPFTLSGSATDPDGDALTYCWEEFDLGAAWMDTSLPNTDSDGNARPIFRSYSPVSITTRTFPTVTNIVDGSYLNKGEALPAISRDMQFRLTARDNRGGVAHDAMTVTVSSAAGPFRVTSPSGVTIWAPGSQQTVAWNVASTDQAPVSCADVNVLLSTDGGRTFPYTLASNTPNDGSEQVTLPGAVGTSAYVKVACADDIFFDVSNPGLGICTTVFSDDHEGANNWTESYNASYTENHWQRKTDGGYSGNNYWFVQDIGSKSDSRLDSPVITATVDNLALSFFHKYDLEPNGTTRAFDAGILEIKIGAGGVFTYVDSTKFTQNGYNRTVENSTIEIGGKQAFSGNSNGYIESKVDLSSLVSQGDTFQIRFREVNDFITGQDGWYVDDVLVCGGTTAAAPSLSISKGVEVANTPAQRGDPITYTIAVANSAAISATGVRITDTLPAYVTGPDLDTTVTVTANQSVTFTVNATLDAGAPYDAVITNTAYFSHTSGRGQDSASFTVQPQPSLSITSSAFAEGGTIPDRYTCVDDDVSPPLAWTAPSSDTQSLALIVDDPDAPGGTFAHWVLFDVPTATTSLPEDVGLPAGATQGTNDFGALGYGGPCPPVGSTHRYYFKLYALDTTLVLTETATKQDVETAMTGHELAQAQLMGRFKRGPSLSITKTVVISGTPPVRLGDPVTYTIVVANSGNMTATGVIVTDTLPAGVSFGNWVEQGSATQPVSNTITWGPEEIPVSTGETVRFTAIVTDDSAFDGRTLVNTATFTSTDAGAGSGSASFTILDTRPPTFPTTDPATGSPLITPALGISVTIPRPVFRWHPAWDSGGGVLTYTLTVTTSASSLRLQEATGSVTTTQTSYTPTVDLPNGVYTWTVAARDAAGHVTTVITPANFGLQISVNEVYLPVILKQFGTP